MLDLGLQNYAYKLFTHTYILIDQTPPSLLLSFPSSPPNVS